MKRLFLLFLMLAFAVGALLFSPRTARAAYPADSPRFAPGGWDSASSMDRGNGKIIIVRISTQRVTAYQGGEVVYAFPVSTGRNHNTALGSFRVRDKIPAPRHAQWNYTMPHWMGVYWVGPGLENGFHALPVLPDGRRLWGDRIGEPASDGCIVLLPEDMERLYRWAVVGTPVIIQE